MDHDSSSPGGSLCKRGLVALVSCVCRFPRSALAVCLTLAAVSIWAACTRLEYHTSRNDLVSPRKAHQQRWNKYLAEFGEDDDMIVVVEGTDRRRMQEALDAIGARLEHHPDLFDRVFWKVDLRPLRNRALLLLETRDIEVIHENLNEMRLLLELGPVSSLSWRGLGLATLLREGQARLARYRPGEAFSPQDVDYFNQLARVFDSAGRMLDDPGEYASPWKAQIAPPSGSADQQDVLDTPQYFFAGERLAFLLARAKREEGSFTAAEASTTAMRDLLASIQPNFPDVQFGLTGMPVLETDEMVAAEKDTRLASWIAIVGVTLLYLLVYRGLGYPAVTVLTLLTGTAWAMGWATLTVGHLNILSAAFAVMLIGMGDYGVLWVMRYEQARQEGMQVRESLLHTTVHVAVGNLTAAGTLALAFFMAMFADFKAVAELGWIAGCGVLFCALACFTILPAVMMLFDRRRLSVDRGPWTVNREEKNVSSRTTDHGPRSTREWLPSLRPHSRWVLAGATAVVLILSWFALRTRYDHNLLNLQAKGLDSVRWEMKLIENTAGASLHALSYTRTREEALALKKQFERLPEVSQVVEVASLVPLDQPRKLDLLRDIHHQLRWLPNRGAVIPHMAPDVDTLKTDLDRLVDVVTANNQIPGGLRSSAANLSRKLRDASMTSGSTISPTLRRFDELLAGDLCESLHRLRDVSTPEKITVNDLPAGLRERHIGKNETWLLRVFTGDSLWEFENLEHFTKRVSTVDPEATGRPFGTVEGLRAMKHGLERAGYYALAAIVFLLWLDFRSLRETALALLPLAIGVVCSLGVMGLLDLPLNPANMIAFPLILGVGVDNGVHLLHDWRVSRLRLAGCGLRIADSNSPHVISHAMGRGVLVKSLTTMIGFGALMISTERGLVSLGFLLAMGVGWAMVAALLVLPALLEMLNLPRSENDQPPVTPASSSPPPLLPSPPPYGDGRGEGRLDRAAA